jgi:hypothetical protein
MVSIFQCQSRTSEDAASGGTKESDGGKVVVHGECFERLGIKLSVQNWIIWIRWVSLIDRCFDIVCMYLGRLSRNDGSEGCLYISKSSMGPRPYKRYLGRRERQGQMKWHGINSAVRRILH